MRARQFFSPWALLLVVAAAELVNHGVVSDCNDSSLSMPEDGYTPEPLVATGVTTVNFSSPVLFTGNVVAASSSTGASRSGESSSSVDFPATTAPAVTEPPRRTERPRTDPPTTAPTPTVPTTAPATAAPAATPPAATEPGNASISQSDESSAATQGARQSTTATEAPIATTASPAPIRLRNSRSSTSNTDSGASDSTQSSASNGDTKDEEPSIAHPTSDSSTFQYVASAECSKNEVDNVYTLYSNCRSAFDLCVAASHYQIFPYQGKHPTQAQIQGMAESDACIAMFVVVIEANFPACTIGGMPLVSVVETLLKISVDLAKGIKDEAPSADVFKELVTWRYEVDLAKTAGVPHDGNSELYAEFEANLDAALENNTIRVNDDLSVDVRLTNGSYETFEDAIDFIVKDASAAEMMPGFVKASDAVGSSSSSSSSGSSTISKGIIIESSNSGAPRGCATSLWSLVVAVVVSVLVLG